MTKKAKESSVIRRSRQKLEKQLSQEQKKVTQKALRQMRQAINIYFERHQAERIALKGKLARFDENRHPVPIQNKFVKELAEKLKNDIAKSAKALKGLGNKKIKMDLTHR